MEKIYLLREISKARYPGWQWVKTASNIFWNMITHSKPIDQRQFIRDTLLDILNNIDVVVEIQEENIKVIEVFDNENTIAALFE